MSIRKSPNNIVAEFAAQLRRPTAEAAPAHQQASRIRDWFEGIAARDEESSRLSGQKSPSSNRRLSEDRALQRALTPPIADMDPGSWLKDIFALTDHERQRYLALAMEYLKYMTADRNRWLKRSVGYKQANVKRSSKGGLEKAKLKEDALERAKGLYFEWRAGKRPEIGRRKKQFGAHVCMLFPDHLTSPSYIAYTKIKDWEKEVADASTDAGTTAL